MFTVAARLGRTVEELRHSMSPKELKQWAAFLNWERNPYQNGDSLTNALLEMGAIKETHNG